MYFLIVSKLTTNSIVVKKHVYLSRGLEDGSFIENSYVRELIAFS